MNTLFILLTLKNFPPPHKDSIFLIISSLKVKYSWWRILIAISLHLHGCEKFLVSGGEIQGRDTCVATGNTCGCSGWVAHVAKPSVGCPQETHSPPRPCNKCPLLPKSLPLSRPAYDWVCGFNYGFFWFREDIRKPICFWD